MFGGMDTKGPNALMADLFKLKTDSGASGFATGQTELTDDKIEESLQSMAEKYGSYVFHDIIISIQVMDSMDYFVYSHSTGIELFVKMLCIISCFENRKSQ